MFHALQTLAGSAVMERATLLLNHVLSSEAVATERLRAHAGRCIRFHFEGWPSMLPAWPSASFRVTPAGLLEWLRDDADLDAEAGLQVAMDASNPARLALMALAGERPSITVAGDATLASDVNWLFDNLRWDLVDDLEQLVGPAAAHQLGTLGQAVAAAVKRGAQTLAGLSRSGAGGGPPGP
jgi:ubiquinone biosynthesis protein UbiJ